MNEDKELIVRKTTSALIEKLFLYSGYDLSHDNYKKIMYNEKECMTKTEDKIKRYYDGYIYLLNNSHNILSRSVLMTFFFIIYNNIFDSNILNKIIREYTLTKTNVVVEKGIELIYIIKNNINFDEKLDELLIPLMLFNYELTKNNIPSIRLVRNDIVKYDKLLTDNKKEELYIFFNDIINNYEFYDKSYFDSLKEISLEDIIYTFKEDKEELIRKYHIERLLIYGSYAKRINRYDSDIDLLIKLDSDLRYDERIKIIKEIKNKYTKIFNRFVDIEEISYLFNDEYLKEIQDIKIII